MEDKGAGQIVVVEDEGVGLIDVVEGETSGDETEGTAQQGGSSRPPPKPRQNRSSRGTEVRKRVASDSSSNSNASSRGSNSIRGAHERINSRIITTKRR